MNNQEKSNITHYYLKFIAFVLKLATIIHNQTKTRYAKEETRIRIV